MARKVQVAACIDNGLPLTQAVEPAFQPFVFTGSASLSESEVQHPVTILQDTGAAQSFLVEGIVPLCNTTYRGTNVSARYLSACGCSSAVQSISQYP